MQVFKVSRNSWHYKVYDKFDWSLPKDFCTYWRRVVLGSLFILTILAILGFLLFMLANLLYMLALTIIANPVATVEILIGLVIAIAVISSVWWLSTKAAKRVFYSIGQDKQPSIIMTKYRSWKDKYCPVIEYTE